MAQQTGRGEADRAPEASALTCAAPMGTEVRAKDGERLAQVAAAWPRYLFVETTPGASVGYWVPVAAIVGDADGTLVAAVTREEAERRGWTERPALGSDAP